MTIVLTGGGTGGHVIPALALVPCLKKKFNHIIYIGGNGIEKKLATAENLKYYSTTTVGFNRSHFLKNLKIPFVLLKGILQAVKILKSIKPEIIFSKGGFVSLPTVIAGRLLKIPVVSHESDFSLGLANKVAKALNATILTAFESTAEQNPKFIYTGFPLRGKLFKGDAEKARLKIGLLNNKPVILIVGGSSGSQAINEAMLEALPTLIKNYNIVHITGKGKKIQYFDDNYFSLEYATNIEDFFALADIVISRAGAGAVSELSALKKSTILIPLPKGNSRGDQIQNANYAKNFGALVIPQENLTSENLIKSVNRAKSQKMRPLSPVANEKITNILYGIAVKNNSKLTKS